MNDHKIRKMKSETRDATRSHASKVRSMNRRARRAFDREMHTDRVDSQYAWATKTILKEMIV